MRLVGLTGSISTGKSTVSRQLAEAGVPLVDADVIARQVVEPGRYAYNQIVRHFGDSVLLPSGDDNDNDNDNDAAAADADSHSARLVQRPIDRAALGRIIFADPEKRKLLNKCTHPAIRLEIARQILVHYMSGARLVVLDAPLLFESGIDRFMHLNVVVACSETVQLERLMKRDAIDEASALQKINAQMALDEKRRRADIVVENDGTLEELREEVRAKVIPRIVPSLLSVVLALAAPFATAALTTGAGLALYGALTRRPPASNSGLFSPLAMSAYLAVDILAYLLR
ncbi:CoaE-domain-containing protein [Ramicandelaber brevisporus]|nr:CoaE-domain-containing protein [Ramicandelaber brevisporus]